MTNKHPYPAIAAGSAEDRLAWLAFEAIRAARAWAEGLDAGAALDLLPPEDHDAAGSLIEAALRGGAVDEGFAEEAMALTRRVASFEADIMSGDRRAAVDMWSGLRAAAEMSQLADDLARAVNRRNWIVARHY